MSFLCIWMAEFRPSVFMIFCIGFLLNSQNDHKDSGNSHVRQISRWPLSRAGACANTGEQRSSLSALRQLTATPFRYAGKGIKASAPDDRQGLASMDPCVAIGATESWT